MSEGLSLLLKNWPLRHSNGRGGIHRTFNFILFASSTLRGLLIMSMQAVLIPKSSSFINDQVCFMRR